MAISGGPAPMIHECQAAKEHDGDQTSGSEAECVVEQPIALHGIADLKLHHRYAREAGRELGAGQVIADCFLNLADDVAQATARDDIRIERKDDQRQLAVLRQQFTANISLFITRWTSRSYSAPSGNCSRNSGAGNSLPWGALAG
jgi:hypothetical protein